MARRIIRATQPKQIQKTRPSPVRGASETMAGSLTPRSSSYSRIAFLDADTGGCASPGCQTFQARRTLGSRKVKRMSTPKLMTT